MFRHLQSNHHKLNLNQEQNGLLLLQQFKHPVIHKHVKNKIQWQRQKQHQRQSFSFMDYL
jgi:hypothetical protein